MIKTISYNISDIAPYINWVYFFHAWNIIPIYAPISIIMGDEDSQTAFDTWLDQFDAKGKEQAKVAISLYRDALNIIDDFKGRFKTHARFGLFKARSHDDDVFVLDDAGRTWRLPFLRQQRQVKDLPCLCLSDFIRPSDSFQDTLGIFATTIDSEMEKQWHGDPYRGLLAQTISDRLAEATCELMHLQVRRKYWGYAKDEDLSRLELLAENYQGIRPAVGYPSLPDQSFNFIIDEILHISDIGIKLTEIGAMMPHASVSGLMFAHPQAHYFAVGAIDNGQLLSYAKRRGLSEADVRKFLASNIQ